MTERPILRITLDNMCIIDVLEGRTDAPVVRDLVNAHRSRLALVHVVAVGASEMRPGGDYATTYEEFEQRLRDADMADLPQLLSVMYWGVGFWGHFLWVDNTVIVDKIREVLFGTNAATVESDEQKWRNQTCDVLTLWAHIHAGNDIFVTRDHNYFKQTKRPRLIQLGAGALLNPEDARALVLRGP